jgi:hypothetical protein
VSAFSKTSPIGVDIRIQRHQLFLYPALQQLWGLADADWNSYGRAYRNQTEDGYTPEVFIGIGNQEGKSDYQEVLFDDNLKALSFYGMEDAGRYDKANATVGVFLIFMVNLLELKPAVTWRADEEVRNDVEKLCQIDRYGMGLTGFSTGFDQVFKEYSGWRKTTGIKYRDQHPTHCFRLNFNLLFDINECY